MFSTPGHDAENSPDDVELIDYDNDGDLHIFTAGYRFEFPAIAGFDGGSDLDLVMICYAPLELVYLENITVP